MKRRKLKEVSLRREKSQSIRFNTREQSAIEQYCEKFRVKNKSKFMREAIITEVTPRVLKSDNQTRILPKLF